MTDLHEKPLNSSRTFVLALICGCFFVAGACWLSSGTMAPYASTLPRPLIVKPCNYLVNTDQPHFEATYLMLQGRPAEEWKYSVVLRRTLFPVLAYPLMRMWGFLVGGVVTSILLQVIAFAGFVLWARRRIGERAGWLAIPLLATYPGIYYWAGLPYSYAAIVPATLACTMIACELESAGTYARIGWLSLALGVLFLAYDLLAYFAPTAVLILLFRRKFPHAALAAALVILPTMLNKAALLHAGWDPRNENTRIYDIILNAYFHPPGIGAWLKHVSDTPWSLIQVFFTSNFILLPVLFLLAAGFSLASVKRAKMGPGIRWILLVALGLFLFINLAPPYKGWQFRGVGIARIYQPVFAAMMIYVLKVIERADIQLWRTTHRSQSLTQGLLLASLVNCLIVFGPVTKNRAAGWVYWRFYMHAPKPMLNDNLALFGRRPLGFCNTKIKIQNPPPRVLGGGKVKKIPLAQQKRKHRPPKPATTPAATTSTAPSTRATVEVLFPDG